MVNTGKIQGISFLKMHHHDLPFSPPDGNYSHYTNDLVLRYYQHPENYYYYYYFHFHHNFLHVEIKYSNLV